MSSDWKRETVENVPPKTLAKPKVFDFIPGAGYDAVIEEVKAKRQTVPEFLFTDTTFPPDNPSLCHTDNPDMQRWLNAEWKRPAEIAKPPSFLSSLEGEKSKYSSEDVVQGDVSDCFFLSGLTALANRPKSMKTVVPNGQVMPPKRKYMGVYRFRFWQFGTWVEVVVDDLLPTWKRKTPIIFARSSNPSEFWISLAEKAYAKLYGSYEAIDSAGLTIDAFVDLTGGVAVRTLFKDHQQTASSRMRKAVRNGSFVSLGTTTGEDRSGERKGLIAHHSYSMTLAEVVDYNGKKLEMFRVRNPWGRAGLEWTGAWSDSDTENWSLLSDKDKKLLQYPSGDGEWYMSYEDILKHFDNFTICSVGPDFDEDGIAEKKGYQYSYAKGYWSSSYQNAGGNFANGIQSFATNPQYLIKLSGGVSDEDGLCAVFIALMQRYTGKKNEGRHKLTIGYRFYEVDKSLADGLRSGKRKVHGQYYNQLRLVEALDDSDPFREVSFQTDLRADQDYLFIPFTSKAGEEEDYLVRIFSEDPISLIELK